MTLSSRPAVMILLLMLGLTGCHETVVEAIEVARVEISEDNLSLGRGSSTKLEATPKSADGRVLSGRDISWQSSDAAIASVANDGTVTAVALGTVVITAMVEGVFADAAVSIIIPPFAGCNSVQMYEIGSTVSATLGSCNVNGYIWDFYEFSISTTQSITINQTSDYIDSYLVLFTRSEGVIAANDDGGAGLNSRIVVTLDPGVYIIGANSYSGTQTGPYQLSSH